MCTRPPNTSTHAPSLRVSMGHVCCAGGGGYGKDDGGGGGGHGFSTGGGFTIGGLGYIGGFGGRIGGDMTGGFG